MSNKSFTAQLKDIERLTVQNLKYVASEAIQDVMEAAQTPVRGVTKGGTFEEGKIPVAEAELINSLSTDGGAEGKDSYTVAIAGYEVGNNMTFAWTAPHAMRTELGFQGEDSLGRKFDQPGRHFVSINAKKFPEFVEKRAKEVR